MISIKHVRHVLGSRDAIATSIALCTTSMPENDTEYKESNTKGGRLTQEHSVTKVIGISIGLKPGLH